MNMERDLYRDLNMRKADRSDAIPMADPGNIKRMVHNQIDSTASERNLHIMKRNWKYTLAAVIALLILSTTALAANGTIKQWNGSSSSTPDFLTLPTQEQVSKYVDYDLVLPERFENGYTFTDGSIVTNELVNETGHAVETFYTIDLRYEKNGDTVHFEQMKCRPDLYNGGTVIASKDGIDIHYQTYTNKLVPADYEMTADDQKAEKDGTLVFSWGADTIRLAQVQSVSWETNGIHYLLLQIDGALSAEDLANMAKELM